MAQDLELFTPNKKILIGDTHKTFIIAEIGQNHQGDVHLARKLILAAKQAGADCVKFQKTCLTERFTKTALEKPYNSVNSFGKTYGEHRQHLELSDEDFNNLQKYAASLDIFFSASAMDKVSVDKLASMNVPFIKIGSGDANNFSLISKAAKLKVPLIVSTGMQNLKTVETIVKSISSEHNQFVLMHCVSSYPTSLEDCNLNLIHVYKKKFPNVIVGYSGHEIGSVAHFAVAAGAKVVERHFTLEKTMKGSDHACSLDLHDFRNMVDEIRKVELVMGSFVKHILDCEMPCRQKLGKSLVASKNLSSGHILTPEDVEVKVSHPCGIPGELIDKIVGCKLTKDVECDEAFSFEFIE